MDHAIEIQHKALDGTLAAIGRNGRRTLMDRIGRGLHADAMLRFRRGEAPDGTAWQPLKGPPTGTRRKPGKTPRPAQPLRDTGRLQRSFSWLASSTQVVIGTNTAYAAAHQFGVPDRGLPARPILGVAAPQQSIIDGIVDKWLDEVLGGTID